MKKKSNKGPTPKSASERFWSKVYQDGPDGCWEWQGSTNGRYGTLRVGSVVDGSRGRVYAHRFAYEQCCGEIADGELVLHSCDNPTCVNPRHLRTGSYADNAADMIARGRQNYNGVKGEDHPRAKLDAQAVCYIRESDESCVCLAEKFGVTANAISHVRLGKTWTHIK